MKEAAKAKAATTKKMNMLAGSRQSLPGHGHNREEVLRAELAASFSPEGFAELLWVSDIAACVAAMELIRAQIAGFRMRQLKHAYHTLLQTESIAKDAPDILSGSVLSMQEKQWFARYLEEGFIAPSNKTFLNQPAFINLLAQAPRSNLEILRQLQQSLHEEAKERDRLINQLERRRRQKMRDAIMVAEEGRRAELFRRMMAEEDAGGPLLSMSRLGASTFSGDDHTGLSSAQSRQLGLPEPGEASSELADS